MSDEKWNRFAATGSVRDYLDYCACVRADEPEGGQLIKRKESEHGADRPAEWNGALRNAHWGL